MGPDVTGTAESQHAVPLQLAPYFYALACTLGRKAEDEQSPRSRGDVEVTDMSTNVISVT